jgi:D-hydroxyproline dehydrogenase subunit alpha
MNREPRPHFEVLVIGGGPAGLAAAARAAECGLRVGIVDDNANFGGQIWRSGAAGCAAGSLPWIERLRAAAVTTVCGMRVFHQPEAGVLQAEGSDTSCELSYDNLVVATGARERFLPFPGWTLPNILGAGGLQAMVKCGLPIRGKRVVVAGSGPLLLAVAAYLHQHGAEIPIICEQAPWSRLAWFGATLLEQPGKIVQALQLKRELAGVPFASNSWPVSAHGENALREVTISRGGKIETIACDYLACGFHLVPNIELPLLFGCGLDSGLVRVNEFQRTTVPSVFCAGEPTGIGGVELSLVEGQIAGLAAAGSADEAVELFSARKKARRFAHRLERTFRLRSELRALPAPETMVCRCEDVNYSRLRAHASWRSAKLQTRCGMGPCQGRVCGPATQFLLNWNPDSVRPPIFPVRLESMATAANDSAQEHIEVTGGR